MFGTILCHNDDNGEVCLASQLHWRYHNFDGQEIVVAIKQFNNWRYASSDAKSHVFRDDSRF